MTVAAITSAIVQREGLTLYPVPTFYVGDRVQSFGQRCRVMAIRADGALVLRKLRGFGHGERLGWVARPEDCRPVC